MDKQIDDFNSSDENVRLQAIRALIARPDPRARDDLLKCLDDEELSIRREALQALEALVKTLPDPAILDGVLKAEPHSDTVIEVAQLMALFGEKAVIRLQKEIDQTDSRRAMQAAWALRDIGKVGWLVLIESAAKADTRTLHILRDALEGIEDPDLYSLCYQMLEQGNLQQRFFANDILKDEILSPEWLEKTLLNEDMFIRIKGLNAFRVVSPPNAKPVVEKAIKTASGPVAYLVKDIGKLALTSLSFADKDWIDIIPSLFTGAQPVREGATWALAQRAQCPRTV